jgi:hypothetical protein
MMNPGQSYSPPKPRLGRKSIAHFLILSLLFLGEFPGNGSSRAGPTAHQGACRKGKKARPRIKRFRGDLSIRIAFFGKLTRKKIRLLVTVQNKFNWPIGWDSKFSTFFQPFLSINDEAYRLHPVIVKKKVLQTKKSLARCRFVVVKPGKMVKRVITITKPFRHFWYEGEYSAGNLKGSEALIKYVIPKHAKTVKIVFTYSDWGGEEDVAFKQVFGFLPEKVGLLGGTTDHSNRLVLHFKD